MRKTLNVNPCVSIPWTNFYKLLLLNVLLSFISIILWHKFVQILRTIPQFVTAYVFKLQKNWFKSNKKIYFSLISCLKVFSDFTLFFFFFFCKFSSFFVSLSFIQKVLLKCTKPRPCIIVFACFGQFCETLHTLTFLSN